MQSRRVCVYVCMLRCRHEIATDIYGSERSAIWHAFTFGTSNVCLCAWLFARRLSIFRSTNMRMGTWSDGIGFVCVCLCHKFIYLNKTDKLDSFYGVRASMWNLFLRPNDYCIHNDKSIYGNTTYMQNRWCNRLWCSGWWWKYVITYVKVQRTAIQFTLRTL